MPWIVQSMGSQRVGHDWVTFTFTLLLAIYFIFILDYRNGGESKFEQFFLFELKMGCTAVETTQNIKAFGPGIANEHTVQWWPKTLCKGENKPWTWGVQQPAIRSWQWPIETNHQSQSYNHTTSYQRNQHQPFYGCLAFEANQKGEKAR